MKTCFFKLLTCDNVIGEDEQSGCQEVLGKQKRYQGPCKKQYGCTTLSQEDAGWAVPVLTATLGCDLLGNPSTPSKRLIKATAAK